MHTTPFSGTCKLVVSDIDFTFISNSKEFIPQNLEAIQRLKEKGILFCFATGRFWPALRTWKDILHLTDPQITDNGATLVDPLSDEVISCERLDLNTSHFFFEEMMKANISTTLCLPKQYIRISEDPMTKAFMDAHHEEYTLVSRQELENYFPEAVKVAGLGIGEYEKVLEERVALWESQRDKFHLHFSGSFTEKGIYLVTAPEITKMAGITKLCHYLNISPSEVASIGDGDNDAEMLAGTGLGFAVANATPTAKASASHSVASNDDAGFAEAIDWIIKS